jgi:hypothetical protein
MTRPRGSSGASEDSSGTAREQVRIPRETPDEAIPNIADTRGQELGSMYDYLAKIILLGPSGTGKYVKNKSRAIDRHQPSCDTSELTNTTTCF